MYGIGFYETEMPVMIQLCVFQFLPNACRFKSINTDTAITISIYEYLLTD